MFDAGIGNVTVILDVEPFQAGEFCQMDEFVVVHPCIAQPDRVDVIRRNFAQP